MDKQYFIRLLDKYSRTNLTKEEREFVESYYNMFQNEPDILESLDVDKKNQFESEIKDQIWDRIFDNKSRADIIKLNQRNRIWIASAAVIVLILAMGIFFTYGPSQIKTPPENISVKHLKSRIIFLEDGTKVILSNGTKLNYPISFKGEKNREVYLEGQAFFDIRHNAKMPFIVHSGNLQTVVLGTAFNIKAISGENETTVSVARGKVEIIVGNKVLGIITPNHEIEYNRLKNTSETKLIKDTYYLNWQKSDLLLDNVTLGQAAKVLEDMFKVNITIYDSSLSSQKFTTTFPENISLNQALKNICEFNSSSYNYEENKASVTIVRSENITN